MSIRNKGDIGRAISKLHMFIYSMAEGPRDIKSRLRESEEYLIGISDEDFPDRYKDEWKSIWNDLTKKGKTKSLSSIGNTVYNMRYTTVSKIVKRITTISCKLDDYDPAQDEE